jgi:hypothetical protein
MRIFVLGMMLVACLSAISIADTGGPDAYGYRWVDNDNGGGPAYNWVDITGQGQQVDGLSDDNAEGPFDIGFEFPYYWYSINQCWIGSNGYIEFISDFNFAHPFSDIPNSSNPNNYMAPLAGDMDFNRGNPSCYFYSNNIDSFVVSWINVGEFGYIDSTHTFQVILCAADSSITYQYGPNHGRFMDSSGDTEDVIGIEDVTGSYGLQYLRENMPSSHLWHDGLAIRFHPIPNPLFQIHDCGVMAGFNNSSAAILVKNNIPTVPRGLFKNVGNQPESNIQARCQIRLGTTTVYNVTITLDLLAPGQEVWVDFDPPFTPAEIGYYKATFTSLMTGDQNNTNNTKNTEIDVYVLPSELCYCDNTAETARLWTGENSGFGVEYVVPDTINLVNAGFYVDQVFNHGFAYIWLLRDDLNGHPNIDHPIAGDTIMITNSGWVNVEFPRLINRTFNANEKFYIVAVHAYPSTFTFGMDQTLPMSNRGWEYTAGMYPDRDRSVSDIMFRIYADTIAASYCSAIIGDVNDDSIANALDITAAVNYFRGQFPAPDSCICGISGRVYVSGDINGSCSFDGIDVTYYVNYFKGGPGLRSCPGCRFAP